MDKGLSSPIIKFLSKDCIKTLMNSLKVSDGDILFFGAGKKEIVNASLGALRLAIAKDLNLINKKWSALWVLIFQCLNMIKKMQVVLFTSSVYISKSRKLRRFEKTDIAKLNQMLMILL